MNYRFITLIGILVLLMSLVTFSSPGSAQAVSILNNFIGFETGGLDEAAATAETPTIVTSPVHSGDFALELNGTATQDFYDVLFSFDIRDTDGLSDDFIIGFFIRFSDKDPSLDRDIFFVLDDAVGIVWEMEIQGDSDLEINDANNALIATVADPFTLNQWHLIEVRWEHADPGDFEMFIDGSSVVNETGQDLTDGNGITIGNAVYRFLGHSTLNHFIDDIYTFDAASSNSDFLGGSEVFRYQADTNSATPDGDCSDGFIEADLDQGVWQDLGETPLSSDATEPGYTGSGQTGGSVLTDDTQSGNNFRPGPSGDSNIDGTIIGAKALFRLKRSTGGPTGMLTCLGNSSDGTPVSFAADVTTSFTNFFFLETGTAVPTNSEFFELGLLKMTGPQDFTAEEIWAFLLHVPPTSQRRIFPVQ